MTAWLSEVLKISVRNIRQLCSTVFQYTARYVVRTRSLSWLILDRVFLTSAADRQSAWSLGGVAVFVQVCRSAFQTVNKSGWVYRGGMDHHHRPVAGLVVSDGLNGLPQAPCISAVREVIIDFLSMLTVLHFWCHGTDWLLLFWGLLYLLIWMLHLWSLAAHEPLLSSTAFGLHVWWWS